MSRYSVSHSIAVWDLGQLGELHRVSSCFGGCMHWVGDRKNPTKCSAPIVYVWAQAGRSDAAYCEKHGLDTFPEARNKPDWDRQRELLRTQECQACHVHGRHDECTGENTLGTGLCACARREHRPFPEGI